MASFFSFIKYKKILPKSVVRNITLRAPLTFAKSIFILAFLGIIVVLYLILIALHNKALIEIPSKGGTLKVGVLGTINSLHPILSTNENEKSIIPLLYAGLLKEHDDEIINDVSESYEVSNNGKTYTFKIKSAHFNRKNIVTAQDVFYTYSMAMDEKISLTLSNILKDLSEIEIIDQSTISFKFSSEPKNIIEMFSIGIIQESDFDKKYSKIKGLGSYKIISTNYKNNIPESITLERNKRYQGQKPYIKKIKFYFYTNENELLKGINQNKIDLTFDLSPEKTKEITRKNTFINKIDTERKYSIYHLNNLSGSLQKSSFTSTLNTAIDRNEIINIVESGYGVSMDKSDTEAQELAQEKILKDWTKENISLASSNDAKSTKLANQINESIRKLGININIQSFDQGFFYKNINQRSFSSIIAKNENIPSNYKEVIPLYYVQIPLVRNIEIGNTEKLSINNIYTKYSMLNNWYIKTKKIYWWNNKQLIN